MKEDERSAAETAPCAREEIHLRRIEMRGFRRSDGLFEIEGRIIDTKSADFTPASSNISVPAGTALHDMLLVLVFDEEMIVREVRSRTDASPYEICPLAGGQLQALVGLSMTSGWNQALRQHLARVDNCTHLVGLLGPMATAAFQSMSAKRAGLPTRLDQHGRPVKIDSCYAYSSARDLVRRNWPEHYRSAGADADSEGL